MSRKKKPEPFFRKFEGWWYVQIGKDQIKLIRGQDNEDAAWRAYYRVMAARSTASPAAALRGPTVAAVCNLFLDFSQKAHAPRTYDWYRGFLEDFCGYAGKLKLSELDSSHVATWLDRHPDWKGTRRGATIAVKRAFNYAYTEGKIEVNPMRTVKKPPARARERFLTREERQKIFDNYPEGDCFRDFLFALENTGCRPGEVSAVTAAHADLKNGLWVLGEHKTEHSTGAPRVIILTPEMVKLTRRLVAERPEGPLFLDSKGRPWNRNSVRCRFRRVRVKLKLGGDLVAYLYRHAVCTDLLESGTGIAQAAELLGHKGTDMLMRTTTSSANVASTCATRSRGRRGRATVTKLPIVPRRTRSNFQRQQEGVQVGGIDEDAAPPAARAAAVVRQAALVAPAVHELGRNARAFGGLLRCQFRHGITFSAKYARSRATAEWTSCCTTRMTTFSSTLNSGPSNEGKARKNSSTRESTHSSDI